MDSPPLSFKKKAAGLNAKRDQRLKRRYGISLRQYEELLSDQAGVCAICEGPLTGKNKEYQIDHDHSTGKIRGLLCSYCNLLLGQARDDLTILTRAFSYLEKAKRCHQ